MTQRPPHRMRNLLAIIVATLTVTAGAQALPPLHVDGAALVDAAGHPVVLKGVNLGNWLLIEPWMLGLYDRADLKDQHGFVQAMRDRFGPTVTADLLNTYRANWITPRDMTIIRSFGMNCVRVPFHFRIVEPSPGVYDFTWLDRAVAMAKDAGLYVILDLHGAPGGQSVDGPTGHVGQNHLWTSADDRADTAALWHALAQHFRGEPNVAAYDLLNEPFGDLTGNPSLDGHVAKLMDRLVTAVRSADPGKPIYVPGTFNGFGFYGDLSKRGWTAVAITEHHYPGLFGNGPASLKTFADYFAIKAASIDRRLKKLDVLYLVGEFNPVFASVDRARMTRVMFDRYAAMGWSATLWSYKVLQATPDDSGSGWGLVTNAKPIVPPDPLRDSEAALRGKFEAMGTMSLVVNDAIRKAMTGPALTDVLPEVAPAVLDAPTSTPAPDGWRAADIGDARAGSQVIAPGAWRIFGGGRDVFGTTDAFRFVARAAKLSASVSTVIRSVRAPDRYTKVGLMLRAGDAPGAAHRFLHVFPDGRVVLAGRDATGGKTWERVELLSRLPVGLRLARSGGSLVAQATDADGMWRTVNRSPLPAALKGDALLGVAVLAHDPYAYAVAEFAPPVVDADDRPAVAPPTAGPNLLRNGSFEQPADTARPADDQAGGWNRWGEWLNRETGWSPRFDGEAVLGYHHWQVGHVGSSGVWQDIAGLAPGSRYRFAVRVLRDQPDAPRHEAQSIELRMELFPRHTGGPMRTLTSRTWNVADLPTQAPWGELHVTVVAPAQRVRVLIVVNPSPETPRGAAVKFDGATLRKMAS